MVDLLVSSLAAWRLSYLLVSEAGPGGLARKLRAATGVVEDAGGVVSWGNEWSPLHCMYCTSVYVAVLVLLMPTGLRRAFALSAGAMLIHKASDL